MGHEMEYTNELTMALVDLVLLSSMLRNLGGDLWDRQHIDSYMSFSLLLLASAIATVQLCIYNSMGWTNGDSNGETLAHYFEFVFEAFSAVITFWFIMDNRFIAEKRIQHLLDTVDDPEGRRLRSRECGENSDSESETG